MGEAKKRGAFVQRKAAAVKRNHAALASSLGTIDAELANWLRTGLNAFLSQMSPKDWNTRKAALVQRLDSQSRVSTSRKKLSEAPPIRDKADEIIWYLYLSELALEAPLCLDVNQAARAIPFISGIGERWSHAARVKGIDKKIRTTLRDGRKDPDGFIFEILVALSYAHLGWDVELIEENPPAKTPDMVVRRNGHEFFVECKRQSRQSAYAEAERNAFLERWEPCVEVLMQNRQWIWLECIFHREITDLPGTFLSDVLKEHLPIDRREQFIHKSDFATIRARPIDKSAVQNHLVNNYVKTNSPMLNTLLGGDWAPVNSSATIAMLSRSAHVTGCEIQMLGTYVDEIAWASGITRTFDSEESIERKARDVRNLLREAAKQLPDSPSIVHIAVETLDGPDVETRRIAKVMRSIPEFVSDKQIMGVRLHLFQANQTTNKLFEFDETIEEFQKDGVDPRAIPSRVVIPTNMELTSGRHWELYR